MPTGEEIRRTLLEVIKKYSDNLQISTVLRKADEQLKLDRRSAQGDQLLLTFFYDLFRIGYLAWGYDINNPEPPFFHLTEIGRKSLSAISRDPANPDGYISQLKSRAGLNPITESYITEALATFNANCSKATAVMVGAAAESEILSLRDVVVTRLNSLGSTVPKDLNDWRIKRVLDAIREILEKRQSDMPKPLQDSFAAYWPAFTQQIRAARNDAGHPSSIDPVTEDTVHASLLIFPELAFLADRLREWVSQATII